MADNPSVAIAPSGIAQGITASENPASPLSETTDLIVHESGENEPDGVSWAKTKRASKSDVAALLADNVREEIGYKKVITWSGNDQIDLNSEPDSVERIFIQFDVNANDRPLLLTGVKDPDTREYRIHIEDNTKGSLLFERSAAGDDAFALVAAPNLIGVIA